MKIMSYSSKTKSENDLLIIINSQQEQLNRYKKRLQDVVVAHKKLISEKERLEETLKAVALVKSSDDRSGATLDVTNSEVQINELKEKVTKLAKSMLILNEEKKQMEIQFHSERKQLMQQNGHLEEEVKAISSSVAQEKKLQDIEVESRKIQLNLESHQRELEFSAKTRELQKIISNERNKRENREIMIEKLKDQIEETQGKYNVSEDSENELRSQLFEVKKQLESENTSPVIMEKLERELQLMKDQHDSDVQEEQMRTLKAEEKTRKLTTEHENRVSKLEQKLAQLSDLASKYDKHRQNDQQMILKLKNRLMQLEIESSNLKSEDDRISINEETLIQQLQHIKNQLIQAYKTSNQLDNLKEILLDGVECTERDDPQDNKQIYFKLKQLEDQKTNTDLNITDTVTISKQKIHNLKSRILELESLNSQLLKEVELERENTVKVLEGERKVWKSKLNILESDYRNRLIGLERELQKQRERVTGILDEKEKQLQYLQQRYFPIYQFSDNASSETKKSNREMFKRQSSTLIYYIEDIARKETEINRLRKLNNELQLNLHDIKKEHFHQVQLYTQLQEDIQRLEKQHDGTEELNTRYLKNVFLNYLITEDSKKRSHMLNAIFAILKFSDIDTNLVIKQQKQTL